MILSGGLFWFNFILDIVLLILFIWFLAADIPKIIRDRQCFKGLDTFRNIALITVITVLVAVILGYVFFLLSLKFDSNELKFYSGDRL